MGMLWTIPGHVDCPTISPQLSDLMVLCMKMCFSLVGLCEDAGNNWSVIRGYDVLSVQQRAEWVVCDLRQHDNVT